MGARGLALWVARVDMSSGVSLSGSLSVRKGTVDVAAIKKLHEKLQLKRGVKYKIRASTRRGTHGELN